MSPRRRIESAASLDNNPLWYKDAVIYQLHVRAYCDSNGDGVGDFRGLVTKLDYLQDLGVTALWLLPFYPSPLRDDGYDIADYSNVHPLYGNLEDFQLFLREAHVRGLRVITELVINHTSDQHAWFQRARRAPAGSPERDFYVWSDSAEKYKETRIIFKDFESSNWAWDPVARAYYWHRFYSHQPDLNFDNLAVHDAVFEVLDFWLGMGIDGLRLDAIPYLYEREGTNCENLPETHQFLKKLRRHVDEKFPGRMLLAEANQWPEDAVAYFGEGVGDECHMSFHFPLMPRLFMATRMEDRFPILDIMAQTPPIPETSQWALFLRNHDELTLEMVTDEDRDYMYRVYAQDPQARINLGIRRRLAPLLENHRGKIELMNGLLFSMPGTPVMYYGDEIGMGDNIYLGDRNGVRTPMQWSGERNAGFSRANPQKLYFPVIIDPAYHYEAVNVEAQQNNPNSLLWWVKRLIALRKHYRAFGRGTLEFLTPDNAKVLAFVRHLPASSPPAQDSAAAEDSPGESPGATNGSGGETILVVANLSRLMQHVELDLSEYRGLVPVEMLGRTPLPPIGDRTYFLTLGPYAFYWLSLEGQQTETFLLEDYQSQLPILQVAGSWQEVFQGSNRAGLEELLPAYLRTCPWFQGKRRQTEAAMILETIPALQGSPAETHVALIQVEYTEHEPETYLLPLTFRSGPSAEEIQRTLPQAVVARLRVTARGTEADGGTTEGFLYDPLGTKEFSEAMLRAILQARTFKKNAGEMVASHTRALETLELTPETLPEPSLLRCEQANTSVVYGNVAILKLFRRVLEGINPDLEVGRFLTEKTSVEHVPPLLGSLEYRRNWGEPVTLAVLHSYVPNQGDAWGYTRDALGRYFEYALTAPEGATTLPMPRRSYLDLATEEVPAIAQERIGGFLETVRLLGQRTAELHLALASRTDVPDFAPEPFTAMYQRSLYQTLRTQARRTFDLLRRKLRDLPEAVQQEGAGVLALEPELLKRLRAVYEQKITALRIRCHNNYHLAQVLWTGKDWMIIDLEGDPERPLSDRRRKRSPLRDVASMIRSFHYAALSALSGGALRQEDQAVLLPWAQFWHLWVATGFLKAYLEAVGPDGFLPLNREELALLLDFYLLKRAVNELKFELLNHPERARVPLQGLLHLLEGKE